MMRVLYVFTFMYSLSTWDKSGTLDKELKIFKKLNEEKGVKFTFLTYGGKKDKEFNFEDYGINIIPIYKKEPPSNKFVNFVYPIFFVIKNISYFKNFDIIKQNQLNGVWLSLALKKITKVPMILRTGYDTYRFSVYDKKSYFKQKIFFKLMQLSLKYSDLITVTSLSDLNYLKNYKITNYKAMLRKNWVEKFKITDPEKRYKNKILTVGRIEYQKNYMRLLKDFKKSNYTIDIVGEGSEVDQLKKFAKLNEIKVNFLGKIDNLELSKLYKNYLFYVSSSLFEGNPKSLLEAMSHGCIPIVSNIENHSEIIKNNINGFLIDSGDSFMFRISTLLKDEDNLKTLSVNAANEIYKQNSLSNLVNQTFDDYLNLSVQ